MATYTPNYNLEKPDATDNFGDFRASYNANMDTIDKNLGGGGGGGVTDVEVNGTSVVAGGVAEVTVPTQTSDLNNDSGFLTDSDITVTQVVSTGTKIATIDVNGTLTDLYSPSGGGGGGDTVSWTQIQATGEKIAEITINGTTTDVLIPFEAKIIVTTTTGLTVTATKGGTTYTATETSSGVYEVIVDSKGTWTVTDGTNTTTVSVTAQTTYNVAFVVIPDGSTVTPTDDIQTWLHCANIWDKNYTTLAEVLADSTTLSALISSNNAVDYLVRSTSWAGIALVPTMTSNNTPSGECIGSGVQNSYPAWKAFDKDTSTFSVTSSVTDYLGYMFETPQCVCGLRLTNRGGGYNTWASTIKVQGTNDGITFTDVSPILNNTESSGATTNFTFTNSTKYKGYVVKGITSSVSAYFNAAEIQFISENLCADSTAMTYIGLNNYCANKLLADATWCNAIGNSTYFESVLNVKIATATDYVVANGVCSAISERTGFPAWWAIDGNANNAWASSGYTGDLWWQFKFNNRVNIKKVVSSQQGRNYGNWAIAYSTDGTDFSNKIAQGTFSVTGTVNVNAITNVNTNADYYRFEYNGMADRPAIYECQFYGREDV